MDWGAITKRNLAVHTSEKVILSNKILHSSLLRKCSKCTNERISFQFFFLSNIKNFLRNMFLKIIFVNSFNFQ